MFFDARNRCMANMRCYVQTHGFLFFCPIFLPIPCIPSEMSETHAELISAIQWAQQRVRRHIANVYTEIDAINSLQAILDSQVEALAARADPPVVVVPENTAGPNKFFVVVEPRTGFQGQPNGVRGIYHTLRDYAQQVRDLSIPFSGRSDTIKLVPGTVCKGCKNLSEAKRYWFEDRSEEPARF